MSSTFEPTPITLAAFDAAFTAASEDELHTYYPPQPGNGTSVMLRCTVDGRDYQLTLVMMPSGEIRRFAREFNGYVGGPQWGCAWNVAPVVDADGAPVVAAVEVLADGAEVTWMTSESGRHPVVVEASHVGGSVLFYDVTDASGLRFRVAATHIRPGRAESTLPCGCHRDTVTSILRGWREQCGSCGAVFTSPEPNDAAAVPPVGLGERADVVADDGGVLRRGVTLLSHTAGLARVGVVSGSIEEVPVRCLRPAGAA